MLGSEEALVLRLNLGDAAEKIVSVAGAVGQSGDPGRLPPSMLPALTELGTVARPIPSRVYIVSDHLSVLENVARGIWGQATNEVNRLDAQFILEGIALQGFTGDESRDRDHRFAALPSDKEGRPTKESNRQGRAALLGHLEYLCYMALLADPAARTAFVPRRAPADLPAEIPTGQKDPVRKLLDEAEVRTVDEWRGTVFARQGLLTIPPPPSIYPKRWPAFVAWAKAVNPQLATAAETMLRPIVDAYEG